MKAVAMSEDSLLKLSKSKLFKEIDSEYLKKVQKGLSFCEYLDEHNLKFDVCIKHPEVRGCDESEVYYKRYQEYLPYDYSICKHMLVREKKGGRCLLNHS